MTWSLILRYCSLLLLVSVGLMPWERGTREFSFFLMVLGIALFIGSAMTARACWRIGGNPVSVSASNQARVGLLAASAATAILGAIMVAAGVASLRR